MASCKLGVLLPPQWIAADGEMTITALHLPRRSGLLAFRRQRGEGVEMLPSPSGTAGLRVSLTWHVASGYWQLNAVQELP